MAISISNWKGPSEQETADKTPEAKGSAKLQPTSISSDIFQKPIQQHDENSLKATSSVYLSTRLGLDVDKVGSDLPKYLKVHTGDENATPESAYNTYKEMIDEVVTPVNVMDYVKTPWVKVDPDLEAELTDLVSPNIDPDFDPMDFYSPLDIMQGEATSTAMSMADIPFSWWRNFHSLTRSLAKGDNVFTENPIFDKLDDVAGAMEDATAWRRDMFELGTRTGLVEGGAKQKASAVTARTMDAVGQTMAYIHLMGKVGQTPWKTPAQYKGMSKFSQMGARLMKAGKMSAFSWIFGAEKMEDRNARALTTMAYHSSGAFSGWISNKGWRFATDVGWNSLVSTFKGEIKGSEKDYRDIWKSNAPTLDKVADSIDMIGHDAFFSLVVQPYGKTVEGSKWAKEAEIERYWNNPRLMDELAREGMNPKNLNNPNNMRVKQVGATGQRKGYVEVDRAEIQMQKKVVQTKKQLEVDIAEIKNELADAKKEGSLTGQAEANAKLREMEPEKPSFDDKPVEKIEDPLSSREVELAVKEQAVKALDDAKGQAPELQLEALRQTLQAIGKGVGTIKGKNVKAIVNEINGIGKKQPTEKITMRETYEQAQRVAKQAARSSVRDVGVVRSQLEERLVKDLPKDSADRIRKKLDEAERKFSTKGSFIAQVQKIVDAELSPKRTIERDLVKDKSDYISMKESDLLRIVMAKSQSAGVKARSATADKIVSSQKEAAKALKGLPDEVQKDMITALRRLAQPLNDKTREKYEKQFDDKLEAVIDSYEKGVAIGEYKDTLSKIGKKTLDDDVKAEVDALTKDIDKSMMTKETLKKAMDLRLSDVELSKDEAKLVARLSKTPIAEMTKDEIIGVNETLKMLMHQQNRAESERRKYTTSLAKRTGTQIVNRQKEIGTTQQRDKSIPKKIKEAAVGEYRGAFAVPRMIMESIDGWRDGPMSQIQTRIERATEVKYGIQRDAASLFDPIEKHIDPIKKWKNKNVIIKYGGLEHKVSKRERLWFLLASRDPDFVREAGKSGVKLDQSGRASRVSQEDFDRINKDATPQEREWADAIQTFYQGIASPALNEVSMRKDGRKIATNENYIGRKKNDIDARSSELEIDVSKGITEAMERITLESAGWKKSREGSNKPLLVYDPIADQKVMERAVSHYVAYSEVLRDAKSAVGVKEAGLDVQSAITQAHGKQTTDSLNDYLRSIESPVLRIDDQSLSKADRRINQAFGMFVRGTLGFDQFIAPMQKVSLLNAKTAMPSKHFYEGVKSEPASMTEMTNGSAYMWARFQGKMSIAMGDYAQKKFEQIPLEGIRENDAWVMGKIWRGVESWVREDRPDLSGAEFTKEVADRSLDIVMKTQPTFEDTTRPAISRTKVGVIRHLGAFSSQRSKNYLIRTKAVNEVGKMISSKEWSKPKAKKAFDNVAISTVVAPFVIAMINTTKEDLREEVMDALDIKQVDRDYLITGDSNERNEFLMNYLAVQTGDMGIGISNLSNMLSGWEQRGVISSAYKAWSRAFKDAASAYEHFQSGELDPKSYEPLWKDDAKRLYYDTKAGKFLGLDITKLMEPYAIAKSIEAKGNDETQWWIDNAGKLDDILIDYELNE